MLNMITLKHLAVFPFICTLETFVCVSRNEVKVLLSGGYRFLPILHPDVISSIIWNSQPRLVLASWNILCHCYHLIILNLRKGQIFEWAGRNYITSMNLLRIKRYYPFSALHATPGVESFLAISTHLMFPSTQRLPLIFTYLRILLMFVRKVRGASINKLMFHFILIKIKSI